MHTFYCYNHMYIKTIRDCFLLSFLTSGTIFWSEIIDSVLTLVTRGPLYDPSAKKNWLSDRMSSTINYIEISITCILDPGAYEIYRHEALLFIFSLIKIKKIDTFLNWNLLLFLECEAKCCGSECNPTPLSSSSAALDIGVGVGAAVVIIIVIFVVVFIVRRRQGETADDTYLDVTHDNEVFNSVGGKKHVYNEAPHYYLTEIRATSEESLRKNAN